MFLSKKAVRIPITNHPSVQLCAIFWMAMTIQLVSWQNEICFFFLSHSTLDEGSIQYPFTYWHGVMQGKRLKWDKGGDRYTKISLTKIKLNMIVTIIRMFQFQHIFFKWSNMTVKTSFFCFSMHILTAHGGIYSYSFKVERNKLLKMSLLEKV